MIDFLINKAFVSACITTQSLMGSPLYLKTNFVCEFTPAHGSFLTSGKASCGILYLELHSVVKDLKHISLITTTRLKSLF